MHARAAHVAVLRGPVAKALGVALVQVHGLVTVACAPGKVVDVAHHLRLHLLSHP